jgi:hypothetical protein
VPVGKDKGVPVLTQHSMTTSILAGILEVPGFNVETSGTLGALYSLSRRDRALNQDSSFSFRIPSNLLFVLLYRQCRKTTEAKSYDGRVEIRHHTF